MSTQITPRKSAFIVEYSKDRNATQAAKRAGYSPKTAYSSGSRLLKDVEIRKKLEQLGVLGLHTLEDVALNGKNELARVASARTLVEYAYGKSTQATNQSQNIQINVVKLSSLINE